MKTVLFLTDDYWHHADTIRPLADILFPPAEWNLVFTKNPQEINLPLTAMHKESAWLFRCHPIVIHDFRPLSHTDFYHIVHLDTKCLSLEPHRRRYLKRQALCYAGR